MLKCQKFNNFHFKILFLVLCLCYWLVLLSVLCYLKMPLLLQEAIDIIAVYFECLQNATIAARQYALRYPYRRRYGSRMFTSLANRFRTTGSVLPQLHRRRRTSRTEENVINVLAYAEFNPQLSVRVISSDLGISQTTVFRILKEHRLHPYHIVLHQALTVEDYDKRLDYCHWLRNMVVEDRNLLSRILWTDESTFHSDGRVNKHNMHYWSQTNPRWMQEVQHQGRWTVNVWCGILGNEVIGPFIWDEPLNGQTYLNFLEHHLPVFLENVPLETRQTMFFQHDGCPAHFAMNVRRFLDRTFPDRWIGRGSLFPWPARSPDLTCLDFHLWGRLKDLVYCTRPTTRENMIQRIRDAIRTISRAELETAVLATRQKLEQCIQNDGRQFEHLGRH